MLSRLSRFFFQRNGWTVNPDIPEEIYQKCVMIGAPHTSGWDFFYSIGTFDQINVPLRFAAKIELKKPILGPMMERLGVIWIDRSKGASERDGISYVDQMAQLFEKYDQLTLAIAAEGTRSLTTRWKSGFYHVATIARVPIVLGYLDYVKKEAGFGKVIYPSGDMSADMKQIMDFYRDIPGKYPELFALDERFAS